MTYFDRSDKTTWVEGRMEKRYVFNDPSDRDVTTWADVAKRREIKTGNYQDPTPQMLADPVWNAIYNEIRDWDINVPSEYAGYCGATGNHATAIFNSIRRLSEGEQ